MPVTPDPRGEPPKGWRWCAEPSCRARVSKHDRCERHRPPVPHTSGPRPARPRSAELRERERRREIAAGLAWDGI